MTNKRRPDQTDIEVGRRLRIFRIRKTLSQAVLAGRLGITFQQLQKYEKGENRIVAGRLKRIADILEVPVAAFFPEERAHPTTVRQPPLAPLDTAVSLRLFRAYSSIRESKLQQAITHLVEMIAKN